MTNTIASLALIKVNWDNETKRQDFIENFVPFIATLLNRKNYKTVDVNVVCPDFEQEFGLKIPYHPMMAILSRALKSGYISRKNNNYYPEKKKLLEADFTDVALTQERKHKQVVSKFAEFCFQKYNITINETDADNIFIAFLKEHDLDILFVNQGRESVLPDVSASTDQIYLINKFIEHTYSTNIELFNFIVDISVGHIIASTLLFQDFEKYQGDLSSCSFYLDIGFLFHILGLNGNEKKDAYTEFIQSLNNQRANLFLFRHTLDEFMGILERSLQWVESAKYDPYKASRATMFFVENHFSASDIEQFILRSSDKFAELNIKIVEAPPVTENIQYNIGEEILSKTIVKIYKQNVHYFDEAEKEDTIEKDVKSISAIYKLRKGSRPTKLQNAKHIFLTTNSGLAAASRLYEIQNSENSFFSISAALTDIFVGTLIWIQSPTKINGLNQKRLIADCYAALQPTKVMLRRLIETAERLKQEGNITEEDVIVLKQSRVARNFLQEETLGDPTRFNDKTPIEILNEIKNDIRKQESERFLQDRSQFVEREESLLGNVKEKEILASQAQGELNSVTQNLEKIANKIATSVTRIFYTVSIAVAGVTIVFQFFPAITGQNKILNVTLIVISILLNVITFTTGFNVLGAGLVIKENLKKQILKYLKGK